MTPEEYKTPGKRHRRDLGSGGLFWRADRRLWVATVELPASPDGRRRQKQVSARTKTGCIDKRNQLQAEVNRGEIGVGRSLTVAEWLTYWHEHIAAGKLRPNTHQNYGYLIDGTIIPAIGGRRLTALTTDDVRGMIDRILTDRSTSTATNAYNVLASALDDAMHEYPPRVHRNVARLVRRPKVVSQQRVPLALDQARHLLVTAGEAGDPNTARWATYLMTGLRQGECLGLTWDRVNLEHGVIDVEWQLQRVNLSAPETADLTRLSGQWCLVPPKAARSRRRVPIIPPLLEVLRRYRDVAPRNKWGLLWTQPSGLPLTSNLDREAWYAALDRAGLPRVVIHATRHTAITIMQALGVPEDVRLAAVGQSTVAVHRAYAHTSLDTMRSEMGKMAALMPPSEIE